MVKLIYGSASILSGSGYGYGDGDCYGYGYGFGDGSGSGEGFCSGDASSYRDESGSGDGFCSGDGSGYGFGYGFGYGSGSSDGFGYGFGYGSGCSYGSSYGVGDGSGYGKQSEAYWLMAIEVYSSLWSYAQREKLRLSKGKIAFWKSTKSGMPANGGNGAPVSTGMVQVDSGPLNLCRPGTLHATAIPPKWEGDRLWIVAMHGKTKKENDKVGALKREIIGECIEPKKEAM